MCFCLFNKYTHTFLLHTHTYILLLYLIYFEMLGRGLLILRGDILTKYEMINYWMKTNWTHPRYRIHFLPYLETYIIVGAYSVPPLSILNNQSHISCFFSRNNGCSQCLLMMQRHHNVIQYKESKWNISIANNNNNI